MPGGDDQSDRSADGDTCQGHIAKIKLVEEAFGRFGEEGGVVTRARDVGISMPWIVRSVDRKVLAKFRHDLFKQV